MVNISCAAGKNSLQVSWKQTTFTPHMAATSVISATRLCMALTCGASLKSGRTTTTGALGSIPGPGRGRRLAAQRGAGRAPHAPVWAAAAAPAQHRTCNPSAQSSAHGQLPQQRPGAPNSCLRRKVSVKHSCHYNNLLLANIFWLKQYLQCIVKFEK